MYKLFIRCVQSSQIHLHLDSRSVKMTFCFLSVRQFEELAFGNDMPRESVDTVDGSELPVTSWRNLPINTIFRVDGVKKCGGETMILDLIDINERVYRTLAPYQLSKDILRKRAGDVLFVRAMGIKKNAYGWYYDYNLVNVS